MSYYVVDYINFKTELPNIKKYTHNKLFTLTF